MLAAAWLLSIVPLGAAPQAKKFDRPPTSHPSSVHRTKQQPAAGNAAVEVLVVGKDDTLLAMLRRAGVGAVGRVAVMKALESHFDPRTLHPGDKIRLVLLARAHDVIVRSLHLELGAREDLTIDVATPEAAAMTARSPKARPYVRRIAGTIGPSFRESLSNAGLPPALIDNAVKAFRYDPDAAGNLPPTGHFVVVYETPSAAGMNERPEIRSIEINDGHKVHRVYRYQVNRATTAFVHPNGTGVELIKFAPPLKRGEVSSPFGWRIHPVFGDWRFHNGVDIRAPRGTPVAASAAGVVVDVGWHGNYGKYIRVRHNAAVETTYSHLSGYARGLHVGERVRQGQVIGYVGRTGVATGNHLYYEMLIDGEHINPLDPPAAIPVHLDGKQLAALKRYIRSAAAD